MLCSGQGAPVGLLFCSCSFSILACSAECRTALLTQLLLVASVFVHLLLNLRPLLVSLGIVRDKEQRGDLYLILSILVLFAAGSIILYYIGWNNV